MPEEDYVWLPRNDILTFEEISQLVDVFTSVGIDRIRLTGGEPLLRKNLADLVRKLVDKSKIHDIALTTNGLLLSSHAEELHAAGLHRLTVSLDTLQERRFKELTRFEGVSLVQEGIATATAAGFSNLKIDTVVIRGVNDDELFDLLRYSHSVRAEIRFIEYMDVGGATRWSTDNVVSRLEMIDRIEKQFGPVAAIEEVSSAPADRFRLQSGQTFGIISSTTEPFCRACDRSRLTADGLWYLCLYARTGTDLRKALRGGASTDELRHLVRSVWTARGDRGAELRLTAADRQSLIPIETLQKEPHLEMHTRGG